jgi:hypothetical protein
MEADRRVLEPKPANNAWPVMVILTGDPPVRSELDVDRFNAWVQSLIKRGASAHTVVVRGSSTGVVGDVAQNITANLGGIFEAINSSTALPDYMKTIATRVAADAAAMTNRYEVEFQSDAKDSSGKLEVTLAKEGARVQLSGRRPF